ncbi:MAG: ThuA domain-containing protein [Verrucomicrobiales bacterium]|nr:ThuA domain-containing protein [Verrucomicrobiales bacterium]
MKTILTLFSALAVFFTATHHASATNPSLFLHFPAKDGTSQGKKIVLVGGDEEYRSEESLPMLGKLLSQRHGFDCTVLFAIDAKTGTINPNNQNNIPGLEALDDADLMIIATRFRQLPDEQLAHIGKFLNAGKPVIGLRTATHAFTGSAKFENLSWGQFGLKILGEKWVNHHGIHKVQGALAVPEPANAKNPILNGVNHAFSVSDVYGVVNLTDNDTILLRGAVTESLDPKSEAIAGEKNQPMMPLAWLHTYTSPNGKNKGHSFCTTTGAAADLLNADLRRLVINAAYNLTNLEVPAEADVTLVDPYNPSFYGFIKAEGHWAKRALRPADFGLGKATEADDPEGTPKWKY